MGMILLTAMCLLTTGGLYILYRRKADGFAITVLIAMSAMMYCFIGLLYQGFIWDLYDFRAWAEALYQHGLSGYLSTDVKLPYPPLYLYILYIVQFIKEHMQPNQMNIIWLLYKLPNICFDMLTAILIYFTALKRLKKEDALFLTCIYVLNPVIFLDSAIWGQTDSSFTFCVVLMCVCLQEKKYTRAIIAFGAGLLLKQQTAVYAPILVYGLVKDVFIENKHQKHFWKRLFDGLIVIAAMIALCLPFGLNTVLSKYFNTIKNASPTGGAYNLWGILSVLSIKLKTYETIGKVAIVLVVIVLTVFFCKHRKEDINYFFFAAVLMTCVFTFLAGMHERYSYSAVVLFLLAYVFTQRKEILGMYVAGSIFNVMNVADSLTRFDGTPRVSQNIVMSICGLGFIIMAIVTLIWMGTRKEVYLTDTTQEQREPSG